MSGDIGNSISRSSTILFATKVPAIRNSSPILFISSGFNFLISIGAGNRQLSFTSLRQRAPPFSLVIACAIEV